MASLTSSPTPNQLPLTSELQPSGASDVSLPPPASPALPSPPSSSSSSSSAVPATWLRSAWATLERTDKTVSRRVFLAKCPSWAEYALSVPGNWFGLPVMALLVLPCWSAVLSGCVVGSNPLVCMLDNDAQHHQRQHGLLFFEPPPVRPTVSVRVWGAMLVAITLALAISWFWFITSRNSRNKTLLKLFYGSVGGALAPIMGIAMLWVSPLSSHSKQTGYFQIASWCVAVIPAAILKPLVRRTRPAAWIARLHEDDSPLASASSQVGIQTHTPEHADTHADTHADASTNTSTRRHVHGEETQVSVWPNEFPSKHLFNLPRLFARDANSSFPSGDTSGAMGLTYVLLSACWAQQCGHSPEAAMTSSDNFAANAETDISADNTVIDNTIIDNIQVHWWAQASLAVVLIALSCLGRMYWLAHHAIDAIMGAALAFPMCYALDELLVTMTMRIQMPHNADFAVAKPHKSEWFPTCRDRCQASAQQAMLSYILLVTIVLITRRIAKRSIFGAGTIHTNANPDNKTAPDKADADSTVNTHSPANNATSTSTSIHVASNKTASSRKHEDTTQIASDNMNPPLKSKNV